MLNGIDSLLLVPYLINVVFWLQVDILLIVEDYVMIVRGNAIEFETT
jgi:hypothetical protein